MEKVNKLLVKEKMFSFFKKLSLYIIRDIANIILIKLTTNKTEFVEIANKNILFVEPQNQGFGDLLFQTPLFKVLGENSNLDVFCLKKHECIINGNEYIKNIIFSKTDIQHNKYDIVFYIGRNTVIENLVALRCKKAKRVILDINIKIWESEFKNNPDTIAWQKILSYRIGKKNYSSVFLPRKFVHSKTKTNRIIIVAGTENPDKGIKEIKELISFVLEKTANKKTEVILIGKSNEKEVYCQDKRVLNLINKGYENSILIITQSDLVIGHEGSFIHISTTLGVPTIVIENGRPFNKYSAIRNNNIYAFNQVDTSKIEKIIDRLL